MVAVLDENGVVHVALAVAVAVRDVVAAAVLMALVPKLENFERLGVPLVKRNKYLELHARSSLRAALVSRFANWENARALDFENCFHFGKICFKRLSHFPPLNSLSLLLDPRTIHNHFTTV